MNQCEREKERVRVWQWANLQSEREKESGLLTTANHEGEMYKQERWQEGKIVSELYFAQMQLRLGPGRSVFIVIVSGECLMCFDTDFWTLSAWDLKTCHKCQLIYCCCLRNLCGLMDVN